MEETLSKIKCVRKGEKDYPERLYSLPHMPDELFYVGNLPKDHTPSVAIVGARSSSVYGRAQAFRYAKTFSEAGVAVISGLAAGIDSEGHKGALAGTTPTFAVLGSGVDVCYPSSNKTLYEKILRQGGGILSEFAPGTPPLSYHFPLRNRIISGLADLVLVVEARKKSGSLITANHALEQGKTVYALPGQVNDALSRGCNELIFDGAGIAYCPEVILAELGIDSGQKKEKEQMKRLSKEEERIFELLKENELTSTEQLIRQSGFNAETVNRIVMRLLIDDIIMEEGRNQYAKKPLA